MKGIILAGGNGNRLWPLTAVTNKHLLPVYNRPMILFPLHTLLSAGIFDILVITGPEYAGGFLKLLGSGRNFNCRINFEVQEDALGIAHALSLAEHFIAGETCAVILGDNIFEDDMSAHIKNFSSGAHIFLKEASDASRFGVAEVDGENIRSVEEKPRHPKSNLAVTGLYLYDAHVFHAINSVKPSARGELEITDVNNYYISKGLMTYTVLKKQWTDSGTFESLFRANELARELVRGGRTLPFEDILLRRDPKNLKKKIHAKKNTPVGIPGV